MTFEAIPDLLADMIEEQKKTREAVIQLAEALAGVRAKVEAGKAIDKAKKTEPAQATVASNGASSTPDNSPSGSAEAAAQTPAPAEVTQAPTPVAASVTYQDAATAITKLSRAKGRDAAVALLAKFGAAKLPDVKPEQFADVIAAANEAMRV